MNLYSFLNILRIFVNFNFFFNLKNRGSQRVIKKCAENKKKKAMLTFQTAQATKSTNDDKVL